MTHQSFSYDKLCNQSVPHEETAMKDKVVMITGANSGIGKAASLVLAKMDATW